MTQTDPRERTETDDAQQPITEVMAENDVADDEDAEMDAAEQLDESLSDEEE